MNRILMVLLISGLLIACRTPDPEISSTELSWPLMQEVTNIRQQLSASNHHYYLSTSRDIYELNDTLASANAKLLISFPDSLWEACMEINHPGDSCIKPKDFDHDFTRNMPDFQIEEIKVLDSSNMLLFLAFNSLTKNKDRKGISLNKDIQTKLLDLNTLQMEDVPYDGVEQKMYMDTMRYAYIQHSNALFPINKANGLNLYTTYVGTTTDSNWVHNNDLIGAYHPASDQIVLYGPDEFNNIEEPALGYLNDDNAIYRIGENGVHLEISLDSTLLEGFTATSVIYLEKEDQFLLSAIRYDKEKALFSLRGFLVNKAGQVQVLFQEDNLNEQSTSWQRIDSKTFGLFKESNGKVELIKVRFP